MKRYVLAGLVVTTVLAALAQVWLRPLARGGNGLREPRRTDDSQRHRQRRRARRGRVVHAAGLATRDDAAGILPG